MNSRFEQAAGTSQKIWRTALSRVLNDGIESFRAAGIVLTSGGERKEGSRIGRPVGGVGEEAASKWRP